MSQRLAKEEFIRRVNEKNEHIRNGDIEIIGEYKGITNKITCHCNRHNITWEPKGTALCLGHGCRLCKSEKISKLKSMSRDEFIQKLIATGNPTKLYGDYNGIFEDTEFICKIGHIFTDKPSAVLHNNISCPYCSGKRILIGFNDLWTTRPDIAALLLDPNDGYKYTKGSNKYVNFLCSYCKTIYNKKINDVVQYGFSCAKCSDGISYPNKFARAFLDQLNIKDYIPEYSPDWVRPYSYDNYFVYNNIDYILEMDGNLGHGNKKFRSVEKDIDGKKRDLIKDQLASEKGIVVIRIDAKKSDCEYIKNNILNSYLNNIFDLSKIDWKQCDSKSQKNLMKDACDLYNCGLLIKDIAKKFKMDVSTIRRYLKKGTEFGWCNYDAKQGIMLRIRKSSKPVKVVNIIDGAIYYFNSIIECDRRLSEICGKRISERSIRNACKTGQPYKGFLFSFIDLTIQN